MMGAHACATSSCDSPVTQQLNSLAARSEQHTADSFLRQMASCQLAALLEMMHAPVHEILELYKKVLRLSPGNADVYHNMGRLLQEDQKDLPAAKVAFS